MTTLILFAFTSIFTLAQDGASVCTGNCNQPAARPPNTLGDLRDHTYKHDFTALEFLDQARSDRKTNPKWPERIHLEHAEVNVEEFKDQALGAWTITYNCSGKPLSRDQIKLLDETNFVTNTNRMLVLSFVRSPEEKMKLSRTIMSMNEQDSVQYDSSEIHNIEKLSDGRISFETTKFAKTQLSFMRIKESGEIVMAAPTSSQSTHSGRLICNPGETLGAVFAKVPMS